jgi:NADH-quinone oxidoreductase subunit L
MGGLKKFMPVTFLTYAIGMAALAGVIHFAGFWSKDEILHAAHQWPSQIPFYLGVFGAFLTAFYMTRQVCYVFFGKHRGRSGDSLSPTHSSDHDHHQGTSRPLSEPHESPRVMTMPLIILAVCAGLLGFIGTPAWPWFESYLNGHHAEVNFAKLFSSEILTLMLISTAIVGAGIGLGWWIYSKATNQTSTEIDPLEKAQPALFNLLRNKFFIDEIYNATVIRLNAAMSQFSDWLDRAVWDGTVRFISRLTIGLSWLNRKVDEDFVNGGFDTGCDSVRGSAGFLSKLQDGQVQNYLRAIGLGLVTLLLILIWGGHQ